MQFKTVAISLFATLVAAESIDQLAADIPSCAKTCIDNSAKQAGCDTTDYTCQCTNLTDITSNSLQCISSGCSTDDLTKTSEATSALCLAVAKQIGGDTYSSAIDSLTSAAGSAIATASAALSSATDAAGSAFTSATGAAGSAFTSATGAAGSAFTSATGTADSSATSASPTATPAAANQAVAGMGMVGAAAIFVLAL
ncbi:hypothetical protein F4678DRAFT_252186 [Xylaria arbuscula]|nr:hypothetical protein F4678DRAFT_252186 [Xylaria arbuscula]